MNTRELIRNGELPEGYTPQTMITALRAAVVLTGIFGIALMGIAFLLGGLPWALPFAALTIWDVWRVSKVAQRMSQPYIAMLVADTTDGE